MTGESIPFPHIPNERVSGGPLVVSLGDDGNNDNNNEGDDNGNFHIFSIGIFVFSFVIVLIFIIRKLIKDSKQAQEEQEQERQRQQEAVTRRANSRQNNENNEILMKLSTKEKVNLIVHHFEQNKTSVTLESEHIQISSDSDRTDDNDSLDETDDTIDLESGFLGDSNTESDDDKDNDDNDVDNSNSNNDGNNQEEITVEDIVRQGSSFSRKDSSTSTRRASTTGKAFLSGLFESMSSMMMSGPLDKCGRLTNLVLPQYEESKVDGPAENETTKKESSTKRKVPNEGCAICLSSTFRVGDRIAWSTIHEGECTHVFHEDCIAEYLATIAAKNEKMPCPCCRREFCHPIGSMINNHEKTKSVNSDDDEKPDEDGEVLTSTERSIESSLSSEVVAPSSATSTEEETATTEEATTPTES